MLMCLKSAAVDMERQSHEGPASRTPPSVAPGFHHKPAKTISNAHAVDIAKRKGKRTARIPQVLSLMKESQNVILALRLH
jgi:hypothetical protein